MYDEFEKQYRQGGIRAVEEHLARVAELSRPRSLPPTTPTATVEVDKRLSGLPGRGPLFAPKTSAPSTTSRTGFAAENARSDSRGRHLGKATLPYRGPPEAA